MEGKWVGAVSANKGSFCLLSFNFNCLFSLNPVCFNYYQPPLSNIIQFDTLTWIIHVLVISVLLSKTTLPLIPLGINPTQYDHLNPPETLPRPPATPNSVPFISFSGTFLLLCALLIGYCRKC
ncbi:hypothetical protein N7455_012519 [Penicillium solitum]|uniref:uncharacterized protein n=1 Tax=Penicillium solitum TaxID=60172 RepID=UPI0032C3D8BB|nr:hypothetical protein N7455_012519 [Penicillium solitum]